MGGRGRRTFARVVALAAQEGPPSPPVGVGRIHVMRGAIHSRVHTPSGQSIAPDDAVVQIVLPVRVRALVGRQTRAQTNPYRTRIAG